LIAVAQGTAKSPALRMQRAQRLEVYTNKIPVSPNFACQRQAAAITLSVHVQQPYLFPHCGYGCAFGAAALRRVALRGGA
jgi:hypothetical protein